MALIVGQNTYATSEEAEEYFGARLHSTVWTSATDATKEVALLHGAAVLDAHISWSGQKLTEDQVMAWPRKLRIAQADPSVIPSVVKAAQCEMALYLLATDPTTAPKTAGYKVMQADTLRLEIDKADRPEMIPAHVAAMLYPLGFPKANRPTMTVTR